MTMNDVSSKKDILLSVIVPVYDVELDYLDECLSSIENQTFNKYELIIVDDGAPSETAQYLDEYALHRENVKVIHQSNSGVAVARNNGLDICNGKYVTFILHFN